MTLLRNSTVPPWYQLALAELGTCELDGDACSSRIMEYRDLARIKINGDDGAIAWCAIFANAMLEASGERGTRSARARSFMGHPAFRECFTPAIGDIVVFWRDAIDAPTGHVGFWVGQSERFIYALCGNSHDAVTIEAYDRTRMLTICTPID